jgi:hypothetical protein
VIEYNWFFNTYEIERGFASLINYKLLIFKMLTWSIVCLAAYAVMHQSKK